MFDLSPMSERQSRTRFPLILFALTDRRQQSHALSHAHTHITNSPSSSSSSRHHCGCGCCCLVRIVFWFAQARQPTFRVFASDWRASLPMQSRTALSISSFRLLTVSMRACVSCECVIVEQHTRTCDATTVLYLILSHSRSER